MHEAVQLDTPMKGVKSISELEPSDASSPPKALKDESLSKSFDETQKRCLWVSLNDFFLLLRLILEQLGSVGFPKQAYVDWSKVGEVLQKPPEDCEILFWNFEKSHWRPSLELIVMEAPYPPLVYPGNREEDAPPDPLVLELKDAMLTRVTHLLRCLHEAEKPHTAGSKGGPRGGEGKKLSQQRSTMSGNYLTGTPGFFSSAAYAIPFQQQLLQQQVIQQQMACYLQRQQHTSQDMTSYSHMPASASPMPFPSIPFTRQHSTPMFWNGFPVSGNPPGSATAFVTPHWSLLAAQRPVGTTPGAAPASAYVGGGLPSAYTENTQMGVPQRPHTNLSHWPRETQQSSSSQLVLPVRYWCPAVTVSQCGNSASNTYVGARALAAGNWPSHSSPFGIPGGSPSNSFYSHGMSSATQTISTTTQACNNLYAPVSVGMQHSTSETSRAGPLANGLPPQRPAHP